MDFESNVPQVVSRINRAGFALAAIGGEQLHGSDSWKLSPEECALPLGMEIVKRRVEHKGLKLVGSVQYKLRETRKAYLIAFSLIEIGDGGGAVLYNVFDRNNASPYGETEFVDWI